MPLKLLSSATGIMSDNKIRDVFSCKGSVVYIPGKVCSPDNWFRRKSGENVARQSDEILQKYYTTLCRFKTLWMGMYHILHRHEFSASIVKAPEKK